MTSPKLFKLIALAISLVYASRSGAVEDLTSSCLHGQHNQCDKSGSSCLDSQPRLHEDDAATISVSRNDAQLKQAAEVHSAEDHVRRQAEAVPCELQEFFTCEDFQTNFWTTKVPGIFRGKSLRSSPGFKRFRELASKDELLKSKLKIKLSTSVSYTGRVYIEKTVGDYVADDTPASKLGNETYYLFGNHEGDEWTEFLDRYPALETSDLFACLGLDPNDSALSFGCAKGGTGVPWHFQ